MRVYDAKPSFASGELSPYLAARIDSDKYAIGTKVCENFIVLPQGGIINRPGSHVIKTIPNGTPSGVLAPFIFSTELSMLLRLDDFVLEVYSADAVLVKSIKTKYSSNEVGDVRWLQSADIMYFFHKDHPTYILKRYADDWTFTEVNFENGPFLDANSDKNHKLSLTGDILHSTVPMFDSVTWIGTLIKLEYNVKPKNERLVLEKTVKETETLYNFFGPFSITTTGIWAGTLVIERCDYEDWVGLPENEWEWTTVRTFESTAAIPANYTYTGSIDQYSTHFRLTYIGDSKVTIDWQFTGGMIIRIVKIKDILNETNAIVEIMDKITGDIEPTDAWAEGAFSIRSGFPSIGIFHQGRLVLAGTKKSPSTVWMSKSSSWNDFGISIPLVDSDAITATLASNQVNEIRGFASKNRLVIFTSGSIWAARGNEDIGLITPSSIVVTPSSSEDGIAFIDVIDVGPLSLYVQYHGKMIRSIGYDFSSDTYVSRDMSILSSHIFDEKNAVSMCHQQEPWGLVWCVLSDGTIATMTLQQEHQVTAWTRQNINAFAYSVCSIPGEEQDDVYLYTKRNGTYCIEKIARRIDRTNEHSVFMDGLGLSPTPVVSTLECLDWERPLNSGSSQGRVRDMSSVMVRVFRTCGMTAGVFTEGNSYPILDEVRMIPFGPAQGSDTPITADISIPITGGNGRICRLIIKNTQARPITILGVFPQIIAELEGNV